MDFNINEVLAGMLNAMKVSFGSDWGVVKETANGFIQNRKIRLEKLAQRRLSGSIDQEFFLARLEDEKEILSSELHAIAIVSKVLAQNAANAAIKVLTDAIGALI